jgi:hypothetical protein
MRSPRKKPYLDFRTFCFALDSPLWIMTTEFYKRASEKFRDKKESQEKQESKTSNLPAVYSLLSGAAHFCLFYVFSMLYFLWKNLHSFEKKNEV